jgi:hypothetical protein
MTAVHPAHKDASPPSPVPVARWQDSRFLRADPGTGRTHHHPMKIKAALLFVAAPLAIAGEPDLAKPLPVKGEPWLIPTLDIRARYEIADVDGLDVSHAFTTRERVGLKTREWNGLSFLVEGEFSQAVIDDYHGGAAGVTPFDPFNSTIADPETNELNQLFVQYKGFDTVFKLGRQRLIYDNAAFVGNVGWRQNEQTYDAFTLSNTSIPGLTLNYGYIDQVNRIFGSDAIGIAKNVPSDIHLFNASYTGIEGWTFGGYAYLMDFDDVPGWNNDTFGLSAKTNVAGLALSAELAYQNEAGPANDLEALYAHVTATKALVTHSLALGLEHLDAGFQTPLATLHAFNGFADVFVAGRTAGTHGGITNIYLSHSMPIFWGVKWTNTLHAFGDNEISTGRGWEVDSVLLKKFDDHLTAIAKLAHFESESALPTTTRFSVELNYAF